MRLRVGTRRAGAVFSVLSSAIFYSLWTILAFGALAYFADPANASQFLAVLSTGLLLMMAYWQLAPVISAGFGASLDIRKLLVYPVSHASLFVIEVLLRVTTCAEMLIVLAGVSIGLLRNPLYGLRAAPWVLIGFVLFAGMNLLLSAGVRSTIERLFARRHMREVTMLLFIALAVLPQILIFIRVRRVDVMRFAPDQIAWPWGSAAHILAGSGVPLAASVLIAYTALAFAFGRRQFEKGLRYDASEAQAPERQARAAALSERLYRLPARIFRDPIAALVEKEFRTLARIPRFRMVYLMSCCFGIILYLPAMRTRNPHSFVFENALPFMTLYGLLLLGPISYWNSFGFDRSAVEAYFSWPIRFRDALVAKNLAVTMLLLPQITAVALVARAARMPVSPWKYVETVCVILISSLYWFAMGNIWSVRIPRPMDPEKMNQIANKMQALSIWSAPLLLLPVGLAYWARAVFDSEIIFAAVLVVATLVGAVFYKVGLESAVNAARTKREAMLMQLSKSDGPLSIA